MKQDQCPVESALSSAQARLVDVLHRQLDLLERVHAQAARQSGLLADGDADGLAVLVLERQGAVSAIQSGEPELATSLAAFRAASRAAEAEASAAANRMVEELMDRIEQRLETVRSLDDATVLAMGARRVALQRELVASGAARHAHGAYAAHAGAAPRDAARYADRRA